MAVSLCVYCASIIKLVDTEFWETPSGNVFCEDNDFNHHHEARLM